MGNSVPSSPARRLPARVQPSLGLSKDVNDTLPLGGHRRPVLGQGHHGTRIQQPVAIRMAHCGVGKVRSAVRHGVLPSDPLNPAPWATLPAPFRPTPLVAQSLALRCAGFEVCTTRCCMSRQVRFLLQRRERLGSVSAERSWRPRAALHRALVGTGLLLSPCRLLGLQGESDDASCQGGRG